MRGTYAPKYVLTSAAAQLPPLAMQDLTKKEGAAISYKWGQEGGKHSLLGWEAGKLAGFCPLPYPVC